MYVLILKVLKEVERWETGSLRCLFSGPIIPWRIGN
jgi:hypothetical protein